MKQSFTEEINALFSRIASSRGVKEVEKFRSDLLSRLDAKIAKLYALRGATQIIDAHALRVHRRGVWKKILNNSFLWNIRYLLSMPFIYGMLIPAVFLHVCFEVYHQVCFRLYGIPRVRPREYFLFDRSSLPQLNWLERINCLYCSYFNGLIGYLREIAGRTERYWCPIKHASRRRDAHSQYGLFVEYSDAEALRKEWSHLRSFSEMKK